MIVSLIIASSITLQIASAQEQASASSSNSAPVSQPASNAAKPRGALSPQERGDILMARKQYREAIETYMEAPMTPVILNKIGIAYHQMQELNTAAKYYQKAAKADPNYADAINNLGTIYYSKKSYRRAIGEYKKALKIRPDSASFWANLANAYFERKQYDLSAEARDKALEIDPEVFEIRNNAGSIVQDRNVADRAMFHYAMAKSYAKKGRNAEALLYMRKAIEEGFKERKKFQEEPEFAGLRNDPEFKEIMAMEPKVL